MSLLVLDVGNSSTVIGIFDDDDLLQEWTVSSDVGRTCDEWYLLAQGFVRTAGIADVTAVAMCCTVPMIQLELKAMLDRYFADLPVSVVGPGIKTGVAIHTDNPREVGADRIVNALAAAQLYGGPAVVVDMNGTATTFDVIDRQNRYLGGAIAPAVELSLSALARRGAQLRSVELAEPRSVIGKNTVEAVQAGAVFGFAGLIDGIVGRTIEALGVEPDDVAVIATGAYSDVVLDQCTSITVRDRWLTLNGLRFVHLKNGA